MQLEATLTNRQGQHLHRLWHFTDLEVTDVLNDAPTGRLVMSVYNRGALHVAPGTRMLKVTYGDQLLHWGIIMRPTVDYAAGTIEINSHEPGSLSAKRNYHRYGDRVVDLTYPIDGRGARMLLESCIPSVEQQLAGCLPAGFLWGVNDTTTQAPPAEDGTGGLWRHVRRGTNVWDSLTNLAAVGRQLREDGSLIAVGPDFRFRAVDAEHPGVSSSGGFPGYYSEVDFFDRLGVDRSASVIFQHNFGSRNADGLVHDPDFAAVRNYWVQVNPGGTRSTADENRGLVQDLASWAQVGIMEGWESSGQTDTKEVLESKARGYVQAYTRTPDYFTVTPAADRRGVPVLGVDYDLGDVIRAQAKKGYRQVDLIGRITQTTVSQQGQDGLTRVSLDCVPTIDPDLASGDFGG